MVSVGLEGLEVLGGLEDPADLFDLVAFRGTILSKYIIQHSDKNLIVNIICSNMSGIKLLAYVRFFYLSRGERG